MQRRIEKLEVKLVMTENDDLQELKEHVVSSFTDFSIIKWDNFQAL